MNIEARIDQVMGLLQTGKLAKALSLLKPLEKQYPDHAQVAHFLAIVYFQQNNLSRALSACLKATALNGREIAYWKNLALIYVARQEFDLARQAYEQALMISPNDSESQFGRANVLRGMGQLDASIADYEAVIARDPYAIEAMNNLGCVRLDRQEYPQAQHAFEKALQINPKFERAWNNLGLLYAGIGQSEKAEHAYRQAVTIAPGYMEAHVNLGHLLMRRHAYEEAGVHYARALQLSPKQPLIAGDLAYVRSMQCDWGHYKQTWNRIQDRIRQGEIPCSPIQLLHGSDDPGLSKKLSAQYAQNMVAVINVPAFERAGDHASVSSQPATDKIRIGYFSSDFRNHPVATLIAGVLEAHDPQRFEVFGYALDSENSSEMRARIRNACHSFFEVGSLNDAQLAALAREHALDLAIDLNGYTEGGRAAVFKARVAPVQISFLGYPGTSGGRFVDYTIADQFVIPPQSRASFTEHVLYLPDSFQPNDAHRQVFAQGQTRAQFGLPDDAVVFCCFNKFYKLTPDVFESWMRILQRVPESVLWLSSEDEVAQAHLKRHAQKSGMSADRLIFAGRTEQYEQHLARYQLADLFLDTFPYTAHTTGSDALWAGLPVLTRAGRSFASLVGESMVQALGMPELVARSAQAFEDKAVALAQEPNGFERLKAQLAQAKTQMPLFQTKTYTRHLESGYQQIMALVRNGQPLQDVVVQSDQPS